MIQRPHARFQTDIAGHCSWEPLGTIQQVFFDFQACRQRCTIDIPQGTQVLLFLQFRTLEGRSTAPRQFPFDLSSLFLLDSFAFRSRGLASYLSKHFFHGMGEGRIFLQRRQALSERVMRLLEERQRVLILCPARVHRFPTCVSQLGQRRGLSQVYVRFSCAIPPRPSCT